MLQKGEGSKYSLTDMVISSHEQGPETGRKSFSYRFEKEASPSNVLPLLPRSLIREGDAVSISVPPHWMSFTRGIVKTIAPTFIEIATQRKITIDKIASRLLKSVFYRIDYNEAVIGMSRLRHNIANLFYVGGDQKRLALIVDLRPPVFSPTTDIDPPQDCFLNPDQKKAMAVVLRAKDYALVQGLPGTGKTFTIVQIIKDLVKRGKSVLLTAYTHTAVDNVLAKLLDVNFKVLRLGDYTKVTICMLHVQTIADLNQNTDRLTRAFKGLQKRATR